MPPDRGALSRGEGEVLLSLDALGSGGFGEGSGVAFGGSLGCGAGSGGAGGAAGAADAASITGGAEGTSAGGGSLGAALCPC